MQTDQHPAQILVIEDNPGDVHMLRYALDEQGHLYELHVISDGEEAIQFVGNQRLGSSELPCAIVLDLHLPKHQGAEVLRAILDVPAFSHVGVVVLTSSSSPIEERQARDLGARIYRNKPFELDEWITIAGEILALCEGLMAVQA